jgi:uncharacterized repeat protein (TIGR03803 family)
MQKFGWWKGMKAFVVVLVCASAAIGARAQTLTTLVSFNGTNGYTPCPEGIVQGADGNFYGISGCFTSFFFKVTPSGALTDVLTFSSLNSDCLSGTVMQASDGNFYGTLDFDNDGNGTIFKITPAGVLTTLYTFSGPDGSKPSARLIQGSDGNLYGTTQNGGANPPIPGLGGGPGTIFKITPEGTLTTLYSFSRPDGSEPIGV